jgi:hypothetical protein
VPAASVTSPCAPTSKTSEFCLSLYSGLPDSLRWHIVQYLQAQMSVGTSPCSAQSCDDPQRSTHTPQPSPEHPASESTIG